MNFLNNISYTFLIAATILMALLPFQPEPHLVEKLRMLSEGNLSKPIDIFDLFWHALPGILLVTKFVMARKQA